MTNALDITCGADLERFISSEIEIDGKTYSVLTGHEGTGKCWYCGRETKKYKKSERYHKYCAGHMDTYYEHFRWGYASSWARRRAGSRCENCGKAASIMGRSRQTDLEIHHIVPMNGYRPEFSPFHLPWNLVALCHWCHQELHAAMRESTRQARSLDPQRDPWELAAARGQALLPFYF